MKQTRLELTTAQVEVDGHLKDLQQIITDWRSKRGSLETDLAAAEVDRLLGISEAGRPSEPELKRDRLFQDSKSRIDRTQRDLEASVLRVRTLMQIVHSIQAEIEDAAFLEKHKKSLERVGNGSYRTSGVLSEKSPP